MSDNEMLYCLIAFILGWLVSRHMGNGFSVGAGKYDHFPYCPESCSKEAKEKFKRYSGTYDAFCSPPDGSAPYEINCVKPNIKNDQDPGCCNPELLKCLPKIGDLKKMKSDLGEHIMKLLDNAAR